MLNQHNVSEQSPQHDCSVPTGALSSGSKACSNLCLKAPSVSLRGVSLTPSDAKVSKPLGWSMTSVPSSHALGLLFHFPWYTMGILKR